MSFVKKFFVFMIVEFILGFLFGPAIIVIGGAVWVFVNLVINEYNSTKTYQGRKHNRAIYEREKKIEEQWGNNRLLEE